MLAIILPANLREPAAAGLRRTVVAPLVALQRRAELSRNALLSHEAATTQRDSLALRAQSVYAVEAENARLRRLLGLGQRLRWGFIAAEALGDDERHEDFTLKLTAGANAGVRKFSPVVAPEGLVGMVHTADPTLSLAITWSNADFRASAMTVDGSAFGIVAAHLGSGADRFLLELRGVPFRNELRPGTMVVTSGLGGVYPEGIPVGTVLRELETSEGWARTYLVRPAVLPSEVTSVMILRPDRVDAGVPGVWASSRASDSVARRVVTAADSIAADSGRRLARRRAADSARVVASTRAAATAAAARVADSARAGGVSGAAPRTAPTTAPPPAASSRGDSAAAPSPQPASPVAPRSDTTQPPSP